MLSIQTVGSEILSNNPRKLYIFGGSEYGIKQKYIQILKDHYGKVEEYASFDDVFSILDRKQLIPLPPCVYIVRYDENFVKGLSDKVKHRIDKLKFTGTIIGIYEADKHISKFDKYLSDYVVNIDAIDSKYILKYLQDEFPDIPDMILSMISRICYDYNHGRNIANCIDKLPSYEYDNISMQTLQKLFDISNISLESELMNYVASRNFVRCARYLELCEDYDNFIYTILRTMQELDKLFDNPKSESNISRLAQRWTRQDIYNMFNNAYHCLKQQRSSIACDPYNACVYLISLLQFKPIPEYGVI